MRLALLAILLPFGGCQSLGNWVAGQVSPIDWNGETRIELPLASSSSGSPVIPVRINGHDATALIDSGSSLPGMSRSLVTATGARIRGTRPKVNGERRESVENVPMQIGSVSSTLRLAAIDDDDDGDYPPITFGANLFLQAVVEMDFDAGRLTLINPEAFTPPMQNPLSVKLVKAVPTIPLRLNGHGSEICAIVDTGFNLGVAVTSDVANMLSLPKDPAGRKVVYQGAFGERYEHEALAPLDELQIGDRLYRNVPLGHAPPILKECENLLGMAVLSQHRLVFDLRNRRIWLLPRSGTR